MGFSATQQAALLHVARESIATELAPREAGRPALDPAGYEPALQAVRASFVTLHLHGALRGCVGGLEARNPLVTDVALRARDAAFRDPRFPALQPAEFSGLDIHISVLSPHSPIDFRSEDDLLSQLRVGLDGLIIAHGDRRATFLPAVWESLPAPGEFLEQLKRKAGFPAGATGYRAWRYTADTIPAP